MKRFILFVAALFSFMTILPFSSMSASTPTGLPEKAAVSKPSKAQKAALTEKINVNTADAQSLVNIPGIGQKKATAIVEYRNANGKFKSMEDLKKVKGIGEKLLEKIKPHIVLE